MRVRVFSWALSLGLCWHVGGAAAQQFGAAGYPTAANGAPGTYYAQVAGQAGIGPAATNATTAGLNTLPPNVAAATRQTPPAAGQANPPTMPIAYPGAAAQRFNPIPAGNPYLPQTIAVPPTAPSGPARPVGAVRTQGTTVPPLTQRVGRPHTEISPLNGVHQVSWAQPRPFMQTGGEVKPVAAAMPVGPTLGHPQQQSLLPNYGTPLLAAANQPTLAPPLPAAGVPQPVIAPSIQAGMNSSPPPMPTQPMMSHPMPPLGAEYNTAPVDAASAFAAPHQTQGSVPQPSIAPSLAWPQPNSAPSTSYGASPGAGYTPYASPPGADAVYEGMFDGGPAAPGGNWMSSCDPCAAGGSCGPWFASVSGLYMTRDVPNNVGLAYMNAVPQTSVLNTEQAGFDWKGGFETRLGRTLGSTYALEAVYWYLDPSSDHISVRSLNNDITSRLDMSNVLYNGFALSNIYENSREQRVYRGNQFQNIELNLWQQALQVDPASRFGMAFFSGVRYFQYREILEYGAVQANSEFSDNDFDTQSWYHIRTNNNLIGWQVGGRGQLFLGPKLRLWAIPRAGIFANVISQQQDLCMVIDLHSTKTDVALLGQIDLGASYQLFGCCSAFMSYRALGIAGVANGDDAIARDFTSLPDMGQINSSGSIILHGVNAGLQFQF